MKDLPAPVEMIGLLHCPHPGAARLASPAVGPHMNLTGANGVKPSLTHIATLGLWSRTQRGVQTDQTPPHRGDLPRFLSKASRSQANPSGLVCVYPCVRG
jgi:hypothetical protein